MTACFLKRFFVMLIALTAVSCGDKNNTQPQKRAPISIDIARVEQKNIKEYLIFNGVSQYQKKEALRANVTGYISQLNYKIGDAIKSGQLFANVRTKEQDALQEAVKIDSTLGKFVNPIRIKSSSTGIITALNVTTNNYIAEGDVLATVVQPQSLVIKVNVPYEDKQYVKIGTPCEIIFQNAPSLPAKITGRLPSIDPIAQVQTFLIALPNTALPENLNVRVRIVYKQAPKALCLPKTAIQTNELLTEFWVMKVIHDTMAIKQKVTPLLQNDSLVQIASEGLKINDLVVTNGAYQMQDSTLIRIKK